MKDNDEPMTRKEWRTAAKAFAALSVLMLVGGVAIGASWQRADQHRETKTGHEYIEVNGVTYTPDERTATDAPDPTDDGDWAVAPCGAPVTAYTIPHLCVDAQGQLVSY